MRRRGRQQASFLVRHGIALAVLAVTSSACHQRGAGSEGATPIYLLTVDTLRADHVGAYGYARDTLPVVDALARDGVLFERAFTTAPKTTPAYASMFTGLYPYKHGLELLGQQLAGENVTVAELLGEAGYRTAGFVSSTIMIDRLSGLGQGFALWDDRMPAREANRPNYERHAADTIAAAETWLASPAPRDFLFVHLIDPHGPYTAPARFRHLYDEGGGRVLDDRQIPAFQRLPGARRLGQYVDAYDAEISYAGAELADIVAALERRDLYDRALIVFTADHGESFGEDGFYFRHGKTLHEASTHVPLVIKPPGGRAPGVAARWSDAVSLVDVMPTILDYAGVTAPGGVDGRSLRPILEGRESRRRRIVFSQRPSPSKPQRAAHGARATLASRDCEGPRSARSRRCTRALFEARVEDDPRKVPSMSDERLALRMALDAYTSAALAYRRPFAVAWSYRPTDKAFVRSFVRRHNRRLATFGADDVAALRSLGYVE